MEIICKYCNDVISVKNMFGMGGHTTTCKSNPNYMLNKEKHLNGILKNKEIKKQYFFNCKKCGKEYSLFLLKNRYNKGKYTKYCNTSCANSHTVTIETKLKISNSVKLKMGCESNIFEFLCENCGKTNTSEYKKRFCNRSCAASFSNKNRKLSDETRNKLSNITATQYKNGKNVLGGKTIWYDVITSNGNIKVQGTYEVRMCKILDKWKELNNIKNWEYTKDRIPYISSYDKKEHQYLLDFKIFCNDDTFYYIETKGYKKKNDDDKWNSVRNLGFDLQIWYNDDIKKEESLQN